MRPILQLVTAVAVLAGLSLAPIEAIGQSPSSEGAGKTRRQLEERPFGGPPPKYRSSPGGNHHSQATRHEP